MIRVRLTLDSTTLYKPVEVSVALPHGFGGKAPPYKTVWALHCAMGSGEMFFDSLGAGSYVDKKQIAVIAPHLGNGYFTNSPHEPQADFLRDEFFEAMRDTFPLSRAPEHNLLFGISMGGFGALRWGLDSANAFASIAAVSGVFDCRIPPDERLFKNRGQRALHMALGPFMRQAMLDASGEVRPDADIDALLITAKRQGTMPQVHLYCGEQDYLSLQQSEAMYALCINHGCPVKLHIQPGEHDKDYWRQALHDALATF
ncbi:hypothetical protein KL86DPRO_20202 [uncultured delta proteobacterium]|uniref:Esterase n=1 Tax=uncultured delta proteobacterium TaxID=34034 RepID=A0A212JWG4_9DELT|nr:hypothetical protein KL86DPRO_20202 [uncultured delta proteobacterium]